MDRRPILLANQLTLGFQEAKADSGTRLPPHRRARDLEGDSSMQHITCDLCGKELRAGEDHRYVVKIEAYPAHDPAEITEADLDEDHMEALSEALRELEATAAPPDLAEPYKNFRFDLCCDCHKKFVQNPLAKETVQKFDFSPN